jgi:TRAP-type C4-dicarboxylate transport system substrate-binding protein
LKIRTSPVYTPIIKALGGTPLSSNMDEVYTMLERKMVDGYGAPIIGISDRKWELVTKYKWGPSFYSAPSGLWYNLDKWKSLTDQQRKALDDAAIAAEKETAIQWDEDIKKDAAINEKAGVKIQTFSPEDEKKYLALAYDEGWKTVLAATPGMATARPMMEKK